MQSPNIPHKRYFHACDQSTDYYTGYCYGGIDNEVLGASLSTTLFTISAKNISYEPCFQILTPTGKLPGLAGHQVSYSEAIESSIYITGKKKITTSLIHDFR